MASAKRNYLHSVLSKSEYSNISRHVVDKINRSFAALENNKGRYEDIANEMENQVGTLNSDLEKAREKITSLENEIVKHKKASDLAVEETNMVSRMVKFKDAEIKSLNTKLEHLTADLKEYCEAEDSHAKLKKFYEEKELALLEQIKALEMENNLLSLQTKTMTSENNSLKQELKIIPVTHKNTILKLQCDLEELTKKLANATKKESQMEEQIKSLHDSLELSKTDHKNETEMLNKSLNTCKLEIEGINKIAEFNKTQYEDSLVKIKELTEQLMQLDSQYQESIKEYHELESKYNNTESGTRDNGIITKLKDELDAANRLLLATKEENLSLLANILTPAAAELSKILKCDMSITKIYSELMKITDELILQKSDNCTLKRKINIIEKELIDKISIIQKINDEKVKIEDENVKIQEKLNDLNIERMKLKNENEQMANEINKIKQNNAILNTQLSDIGNQICLLLEHAEKGTPIKIEDNSSEAGDRSSFSKLIVAFRNIEDLLKNNQELIQKVEVLFGTQLSANSSLELGSKVKSLENTVSDLRDMQILQSNMLDMATRQRNIYKNLLDDYVNKKRQESFVTRIDTTNHDSTSDAELIKCKKQLEDLKKAHEIYKKEKDASYRIVCEENDSMRREIKWLTVCNSRSESSAETQRQRASVLDHLLENTRAMVLALQQTNDMYREANCKYEENVQSMIKSFSTSLHQKELLEKSLKCTKRNENILIEKETVLQAEVTVLRNERENSATIEKNLEAMNILINSEESEKIAKLELNIKELLRNIEFEKRKNDEYIAEINSLKFDLNTEKDISLKRKQQDDDLANKMRAEITQLRLDLENRNKSNVELAKKLKIALTSDNSTHEIIKKNNVLEGKITEKDTNIKYLEDLLKEFTEKYETVETKFKQLNDEYRDYKTQSEDMLSQNKLNIKQFKDRCTKLEEDISVLEKNSGCFSDVDRNLKEALINLSGREQELNYARLEANELKSKLIVAEEKYAKEMLLHSHDMQTLTEVRGQFAILQNQLQETIAIKDKEIKNMELDLSLIRQVECGLRTEYQELLLRFDDVNNQNNLLHEQIEHFITMSQSDSLNESGNKSKLNTSINEDENTSSEQLLKIIKYIRKEKGIIKGKCDVYESVNTHLKEQVNCLEKRLVETKETMSKLTECKTSEKDSQINEDAEHSNISLNALMDSGRILRNERDTLANRVKELLDNINTLESEITPLKHNISELTDNNKLLASENNNLKKENTSIKSDLVGLKNRVNALADRSIKVGPEDWTRLQKEREALAKMVSSERETVAKLTQELNSLKTDYEARMLGEKETITRLTQELDSIKSDYEEKMSRQKETIAKLTEELDSLRKKHEAEKLSDRESITRLTQELEATKTDHNAKISIHKDSIAKLTQELESVKSKHETKMLSEKEAITRLSQELDSTKRDQEAKILSEKKTIAKLTQELDSIKRGQEAKILNEKKTIAKLTQELDSIKSKHEALVKENKVLKQKAQDYENDKIKNQEELTKLIADNKSISNAVERYRKVIDDGKHDALKSVTVVKTLANKYKEHYENLARLLEERTKHYNPDYNYPSNDFDFEKVKANLIKNYKLEDETREQLKVSKDKIVEMTTDLNLLKQKMSLHHKHLEESNDNFDDLKTRQASEGTTLKTDESKVVKLKETETKTNLRESSEKSTTEPPTANIKPMAGKAQQIVPASRRSVEPGHASVRPVAQVGPSAPDNHSSENMPSSSSKRSRAVQPPESTKDNTSSDSMIRSSFPQMQAQVQLVLPRIEFPIASATSNITPSTSNISAKDGPLSSGSGNQSSTSGFESTGVSTSLASKTAGRAVKRPRPTTSRDPKKMRAQEVSRSEDVEYQVPTSSRSDQDEECGVTRDADEGPCIITSFATCVDDDDDEEDNVPLAGHVRKAKPESSASHSKTSPKESIARSRSAHSSTLLEPQRHGRIIVGSHILPENVVPLTPVLLTSRRSDMSDEDPLALSDGGYSQDQEAELETLMPVRRRSNRLSSREEQGPTVSSQGSSQRSPRRTPEEGREAEARAGPHRRRPDRTSTAGSQEIAPLIEEWHAEDRETSRRGRGARRRAARRNRH